MSRFYNPVRRQIGLLLVAVLPLMGIGCAAMTNPTVDAVPLRKLPAELLVCSKVDQQTIPLHLLRQPMPPTYIFGPGDVLGVYVEGYLGERTQQLPIHLGPRTQNRDQRVVPAASGYPITIDADGTIDLPGAGRIHVEGKTLPQIRDSIRQRYVNLELLRADTGIVLVSLLQQRQYSVLVFRQEASNFTSGGPDGRELVSSKRGTGYEIDLPAYENDVLHALARTGGLPGLDTYNELVIQRGCFYSLQERAALLSNVTGLGVNQNPLATIGSPGEIIRIPLRAPQGHVPAIKPEDIILRSGDVVFLEARDQEVFYTAGLLPTGIHILPRDRDLDVLEAVATVRGPLINGAFGGNNLSGALLQQGIGNPSPSQVTVVRRTPGGGQVNIRVDLRAALRDPSERLVLKAGDIVLLQETPGEAMTRYVSQTFLNFNLFWKVFEGQNGFGVLDISTPDRLQNRLGTINFNLDR